MRNINPRKITQVNHILNLNYNYQSFIRVKALEHLQKKIIPRYLENSSTSKQKNNNNNNKINNDAADA